MSLPPQPMPVPDWAASTPDWAPPAAGWTAPRPAWSPAAPPGTGAPAVPARRTWTVPVVLVALVALAAGAVVGASLVTAVFVGSAVDIGRGLGEGMASAMEDSSASMQEDLAWSAYPPIPPEDISNPVAPVPGPDPVLNAYAQSCFDGDYQACDDLYYESAPLSDYEEYGGTCGGRVKFYNVSSCTELD